MSLVNDMLRDLDQRRQPGSLGDGVDTGVSPAPQSDKPQTNWLRLVVLSVLVLLVAGGLWLYDNPQLWQQPSVAKVQSPAPVVTEPEPSVQPAVEPPPAAVVLQQAQWQLQGEQLQLLLQLNRAPLQRVEISTERSLQLDLGPMVAQVGLADAPSDLIRSTQLVDNAGALSLQLEVEQPVQFEVSSQTMAPGQRLVIAIEPKLSQQLVEVASTAAVVTQSVESAAQQHEPAVPQSEAVVAASPAAQSRVQTPAQQPQLPTAPLRKTNRQSPEQRDAAAVAQARELIRNRQISQAQQLLHSQLEQQPDAIQSRTLLATLAIGRGQHDQALQLIEQGLEALPEDAGLRKLKARLLLDQQQLDAAIALLEPAQPGVAEDPEFHQIRAAALQADGQHQAAAQAYHALLKTRADQPAWWIGLGLSLEALEQADSARQAYRNVLKIPDLEPALSDYVRQRLARLGG